MQMTLAMQQQPTRHHTNANSATAINSSTGSGSLVHVVDSVSNFGPQNFLTHRVIFDSSEKNECKKIVGDEDLGGEVLWQVDRGVERPTTRDFRRRGAATPQEGGQGDQC